MLKFKGKLSEKIEEKVQTICKNSREPNFEFTKTKGGFELSVEMFDINDHDYNFTDVIKVIVNLVKKYGKMNGKLKVVGSDAGGSFWTGVRVTNNKIKIKNISISDDDWY